MEINEMTLDQIEARKLEIKALVDDGTYPSPLF